MVGPLRSPKVLLSSGKGCFHPGLGVFVRFPLDVVLLDVKQSCVEGGRWKEYFFTLKAQNPMPKRCMQIGRHFLQNKKVFFSKSFPC